MGELTDELLIIVSNEVRLLREQSGKTKEPHPEVVSQVGDLLRVLTYVKRNRDNDLNDEVNGLTTEQVKERLKVILKVDGGKSKDG